MFSIHQTYTRYSILWKGSPLFMFFEAGAPSIIIVYSLYHFCFFLDNKADRLNNNFLKSTNPLYVFIYIEFSFITVIGHISYFPENTTVHLIHSFYPFGLNQYHSYEKFSFQSFFYSLQRVRIQIKGAFNFTPFLRFVMLE